MLNVALTLAGIIGATTAIVHGILTNRLMTRPVDAHLSRDRRVSAAIRTLVPLLLQYSTYSWLIGGIALIAVANGWQPGARIAIGLLVGSMFLYGAVANLWGTRGRHPGWMLMALAVALIAFDLLG